MTCIGVITPVYYPSLVFLADFKSRDFLGLEMYAYEHTSSTKNAGTHTHTKAWVHAVGCTKRQKKSQVRQQRGVTRHLKRAKKTKVVRGLWEWIQSVGKSDWGFRVLPNHGDGISSIHAYFLCDLSKSPNTDTLLFHEWSDIGTTYRYCANMLEIVEILRGVPRT